VRDFAQKPTKEAGEKQPPSLRFAKAGLRAEQALTTEGFVSFVSFCLKTLYRRNPAFQTGFLWPLAACQRPAPSGNLAPWPLTLKNSCKAPADFAATDGITFKHT